jgi:hypothetical protein
LVRERIQFLRSGASAAPDDLPKVFEQFVIRREVYRRIQEAFRENGIEFAYRNVTVYMPKEENQLESGEEQGEKPAASGASDKKIIETGAAAAIAAAQAEEDQKKDKQYLKLLVKVLKRYSKIN